MKTYLYHDFLSQKETFSRSERKDEKWVEEVGEERTWSEGDKCRRWEKVRSEGRKYRVEKKRWLVTVVCRTRDV